MVWNLIPPNISFSASFSIYRNSIEYRFQFCGLSLYQEIGKKAIENPENESSKHKMLDQNFISKIPNQLIGDMGDRFFLNHYLFYFFGVGISRVGFAD